MEHIGIYLKDIYLNHTEGQLYFQQANTRKHLYFRNGKLIYARTNLPQELIGEVLFKLGKVSKEVYSKIDEYIVPKRTIGEVLVEHEVLSQADLIEGLKYQLREITLNLFSIFNGNFKIKEGLQSSEESFDATIDIPELIEDGLRRMKYDENLKSFLENRIPVLKDKTYFFHLTEDEKEIYAAIDGQLSSDAILSDSDFSSEMFWKSVYLFYCLNLIDLSGEGKPAKKTEKKDTPEPPITDDRVKEVLYMSDRLSNLDYYQILEVTGSATPAEIKKAYFQLARKYHPDLFDRGLPDEIKRKIDGVFDYITKAYHVLSDEDQKKKYDARKDVPKSDDKKDADKRAEIKFRQGKTLYDQTRFEEAMIFLQEAVRLDPFKSKYFLLLAMTQSKIKVHQKKAVDNFRKAIHLEPWNPDGYLGLGLMYKKENMRVMAIKQFKQALQVDPDHPAALKELEELEGAGKKKGLKDLLSFDSKDIKEFLKKDPFKKKP